jgi:predicted DNA-binding protein
MEDRYVRTTIRLPQRVHAKLQKEAYRQKKSLNTVLLDKISSGLQNLGKLERFYAGEKKLGLIRKKYQKQVESIDSTRVVRELRDGRVKEIWDR